MITKESYVTASFIDNERNNIEVLLKRDNPDEVTPYIIEVDEDSSDYQDLLKLVSIEDLHEITHEKKKAEGHEFKALALEYAKASGLVEKENQLEKRKSWPAIVNTVFDNSDESEEDLFALKLALFEVEKIRSSKNAAVKTQLRKSKTKFEVLQFAFTIAAEADAAAALLPVPERKKKTAAEKKEAEAAKKDTDAAK
jgi:hypothetical protein